MGQKHPNKQKCLHNLKVYGITPKVSLMLINQTMNRHSLKKSVKYTVHQNPTDTKTLKPHLENIKEMAKKSLKSWKLSQSILCTEANKTMITMKRRTNDLCDVQ